MWIYEHTNWTEFSWNSDLLASKLADVHYHQGLLLGRMQNLGFRFKQEANLDMLTSDIVKSSAIEGEELNSEEVRSSIARKLGMDIAGLVPVNRDVDGIVEIMLDATQKFNDPLTKERLFDWHAALFPTGRSGIHKIIVGSWRTEKSGPMQVISGPIGREKIHFEAPHADKIDQEMMAFLDWFETERKIDPILKAAIAHFWFVTIHPFEDGNGRIARAISDMALARSDKTADRFYSLSTQIELERKDYYKHLEFRQRGTSDITDWLDWFLNCLGRAITNASNILNSILFKAEFWKEINKRPVNERQCIIINLMLENDFQGNMTTSKYAKLAKCSTDTALRDIQELKAQGILIQNLSRGRSTSYRLPKL